MTLIGRNVRKKILPIKNLKQLYYSQIFAIKLFKLERKMSLNKMMLYLLTQMEQNIVVKKIQIVLKKEIHLKV